MVSFVYPVESHDHCLFWMNLIGLNRSHDLSNLPCSFQLNCPHQVVLFIKKWDYPLIKVFEIYCRGSKCSIFHKIGKKPQIRSARGVPFMEDIPETG